MGKSKIVYILVGGAFLAVSLWVWLSKGKNATALRAKYKLGGLLISTMALLNLSSCGRVTCYDTPVMCYDTMPFPNTISPVSHQDTLHPGDTLLFFIQDPSFPFYSYQWRSGSLEDTVPGTFLSKGNLRIQAPETPGADSLYYLVLEPLLYRGKAVLNLYAEKTDQMAQDSLLRQMEYEIRDTNL